jgi:ectoine hydroxylase-related dioxygenase (phytanoyl-CoA dioxygenase family)
MKIELTTPSTEIHPLHWSDASEKPERLRARLDQDGYLAMHEIAPMELALQVRRDILGLCQEAGWLDPDSDVIDGRWNGGDVYTEGDPAHMEIYKQVVRLASFNAFPQQPVFINLASRLLGETAFNHNLRIARIIFPKNTSQSIGAHQDHFYLPGTAEVLTMWTALGDCPIDLGVLAILRSSNRLGLLGHEQDASKKFAGMGVRDEQWKDSADLQWVAGDMQLGDVLIFHSHTVHKAMPNRTDDQMRLSLDNRYQGVGKPVNMKNLHLHYNI